MSGYDYIPMPTDGVAWVTGASSGIGLALTRALVAEGWTVYATARSVDALTALAAEDPRIIAAPGNVTDAEAMRDIVETIRRDGRLALAVLNAGVYHPMRAQAYDVAKAAQVIEVNLAGVSNCVGPAMEAMLAQERRNGGRGCLALVASVAGYRGLPRAAPYSATKAGVIAMAEALAFDLTPRDVRISVINPGFVETEATAVNNFKMPFLIQPEQAAAEIVKGLKRGGFEIAFPRAFVRILKVLGWLGPRSYNWVVRKMVGWDKVVD